jgi:hypothetical protein
MLSTTDISLLVEQKKVIGHILFIYGARPLNVVKYCVYKFDTYSLLELTLENMQMCRINLNKELYHYAYSTKSLERIRKINLLKNNLLK